VELHPEEIAVKAERFLHVFNGYREVFDSPDGHGFLLSLSRRYGSRPGFEVNRLLPRITIIALIWRQALTAATRSRGIGDGLADAVVCPLSWPNP
jgi:hypothetical protein